MDMTEVEKRCCVVSVSDCGTTAVSCSGVIVHPAAGVVLCPGLPFSRFLTERRSLSTNSKCLSPQNFTKRLEIRLSLGTRKESSKHNVCDAQLVMLVHCPEFKLAFQSAFLQNDRWSFHGDSEDEELVRNAQFLSWFAVLKTNRLADLDSGVIKWLRSSSLEKGDPVVACGSPFGSLCVDLFINTISRGIISNLTGEDNAIILTDARCLPGTEGGGLFRVKGPDCLHFIGMIVSPFGWKAHEWIGLSLVCSVQVIFRNILSCAGAQSPLRDLQPAERDLNISTTSHRPVGYPTVCFVDSGSLWGSGVVVSPQLVLTCRHVVHEKSAVTLKFHHKRRVLTVPGDVLFSTNATSPYDVAVVQLREPVPEALVPRMAESFSPGESVLVVGYGGLGQTCGPSLTSGILSKTIDLNHKPVMLQTTCAVQAGASGGAVVRRHTGELLGIVSSNTRDLTAKATYPHLNFSVPVTVLQRLLHQFTATRDVDVWKDLNTTEEEVKRVWRLQDSQSKL
ncbi:peroxisomal leader peptide-processing protease [Synchiropus splendidus]|uniref:peroxisomal leader peptide-processing protease n=1 Tax=Synchiropus splendidus TaxID=270530 RepID=UPI00237D9AB7|nr:peroxisomal leader peptide-processing protease [Synchiropus splendidus]